MNYVECENYISDIPKFVKGSSIDNTKRLLQLILNNRQLPKIIHVAGTNGKGSVCTYIESILLESGCSVGKFVSPHLVSMRERIYLNGEQISEPDFIESFQNVKNIIDKETYHPNYFEYLMLMALDYYIAKQPEYIILETGLGGRFDATNSVTDDALVVLTEIGMDHMAYLGDTYEKIAAEKAGIIKKNNRVIFIDKRKECTAVIENRVGETDAEAVKVNLSDIEHIDYSVDNGCMNFSYKSKTYSLGTVAAYQCENAAIAIEAVNSLGLTAVTYDTVKKGLEKSFWPGRMELLDCGVYLDGAHNEDGITAFLDTVKSAFGDMNCKLLFGVVADKEYEKMVRLICESKCFSEIFVVKLETDRSRDLDTLKSAFARFDSQKVSFYNELSSGFELLQNEREKAKLFAVGSLYLVGQIKELVN